MAKQTLGLGSAANDNTGDTLRAGGDKINDNFSEVYTALGNGTNLTVTLANPAVGHVLRYNGSTFTPSDYTQLTSALDVNNNSIISSSNGNIVLAPNGTGDVTISNGGITSTFEGTDGTIDFPTTIKYKNEYAAIGSTPLPSLYEFVSIKSKLSGNLATIAIAVIPLSINLFPASIKVSGFSIKPPLMPFDSKSTTIPKGFFVKT